MKSLQDIDFYVFAKIITDVVKKCFFCGSPNVVRNGLRGRKQQYKCRDCGRQFLGGIRRDKSQVISEYIEGKQTRKQLAAKYGVSVRTIERDLEGMRYVQKVSKDRSVVIQMDTTYWGRDFGLMVIKDMIIRKDAPSPRLPLRG